MRTSKELVNNVLVDHLKKCGIFSGFQYGFRSSWSTTDLLIVLFEKIAMDFNRSGDTRAVTLNILKALDRICHVGHLNKVRSYQILCLEFGLFGLFWVIDGLMWYWMGSLYKNIQLLVEFSKGPSLILHFSCYTLMTFLMIFAFYDDDTTIYVMCDQTYDLWQQLEMAVELESDLWDTVNSGRKCLADFNNQKTQLLSFDWFNNTAVIYVKIDGSFLEGKSSFKMLGLSFSSQSKLKFFYYFNF